MKFLPPDELFVSDEMGCACAAEPEPASSAMVGLVLAAAAFTSRRRVSAPVALVAFEQVSTIDAATVAAASSTRQSHASIDPLSDVVALLEPRVPRSMVVDGAGSWRARHAGLGHAFCCVVLEGSCRWAADGQAPITLVQGDVLLVPAGRGFTMASLQPAASEHIETVPMDALADESRLGNRSGASDVRLLMGDCVFGSPDAALLLSVLPRALHVRGEEGLATIVQVAADEARERRPARDALLARLLEVLVIEAFRSKAGAQASPGLLRGLADSRLAVVLQQVHAEPGRPWTLAEMAGAAALSRSAFVERFSRAVGVAPMAYLLAWRMALARKLLRRQEAGVSEVARRVGYGSASAFSLAFTRHVGMRPGRYAAQQLKLHTG
ncbi:AraC family transcriptional regulator [soil metagenome]